jgi:hypothetical protein
MRGGPEFHDDVADLRGEPRIADQGDEEVFFLRQVMRIANADQRMFLERGQNAVDRGTNGGRRPACGLRFRRRGHDKGRRGPQCQKRRASRHWVSSSTVRSPFDAWCT